MKVDVINFSIIHIRSSADCQVMSLSPRQSQTKIIGASVSDVRICYYRRTSRMLSLYDYGANVSEVGLYISQVTLFSRPCIKIIFYRTGQPRQESPLLAKSGIGTAYRSLGMAYSNFAHAQ